MQGLESICPECRKGFKTESGLKWHLFHIHKWKDVEEIIKAPSPSQLALIAVMEDALLSATAQGLGMNVGDLRRLIQRHYGKDI